MYGRTKSPSVCAGKDRAALRNKSRRTRLLCVTNPTGACRCNKGCGTLRAGPRAPYAFHKLGGDLDEREISRKGGVDHVMHTPRCEKRHNASVRLDGREIEARCERCTDLRNENEGAAKVRWDSVTRTKGSNTARSHTGGMCGLHQRVRAIKSCHVGASLRSSVCTEPTNDGPVAIPTLRKSAPRASSDSRRIRRPIELG